MIVAENFPVKIEITINLSAQDIDDIMTSALEGGIAYWCRRVEVIGGYLGEWASEQISRGGELKLYDAESEDTWVLTRDKFLKGVKLWLTNGMDVDHGIVENGLETSVIDAVQADCIIQYAIFGKVVFG